MLIYKGKLLDGEGDLSQMEDEDSINCVKVPI